MARGTNLDWPGYYGERRSICISLGRPQVVRKAQYDPRRARSEKQFTATRTPVMSRESGKIVRMQCVGAQIYSFQVAHIYMGIDAG